MKKKTDHIWKIYKITNGKKCYVGLTSQNLSTRFSQHKKAARDLKSGATSRTKQHFAYTRKFYGDLLHGTWRIELLEEERDHAKAVLIEHRLKKKHETYAGFSQLDKKR